MNYGWLGLAGFYTIAPNPLFLLGHLGFLGHQLLKPFVFIWLFGFFGFLRNYGWLGWAGLDTIAPNPLFLLGYLGFLGHQLQKPFVFIRLFNFFHLS